MIKGGDVHDTETNNHSSFLDGGFKNCLMGCNPKIPC